MQEKDAERGLLVFARRPKETFMRKLATILSTFVLAACSSYDPVTPAPVVVAPAAPVVTAPATAPVGTVAVVPAQNAGAGTTVVVPTAVRHGNGRIESITTVATAAGGTSKPIQRIAVRMEDGTVQVLDTPATGLSIGERVELTKDGMIRH
jgi:hypothetical protein